MDRRTALVTALSLLTATLAAVPLTTARPTGTGPGAGEVGADLSLPYQHWIVAFDSLAEASVDDGEWRGHEVVSVNDALGFAVVEVDNPVTFHTRDRFADNVDYVEWDDPTAFTTTFTPDDPQYDDQYGFPQINAPGAWDTTLGDDAIKVGVVDTGIDQDHEDLEGTVAGQYDFANDDETANDACGHGTHVAGTVSANTDNGVGVAGTADGVQLLIAKSLTNSLVVTCTGSASDIADGVTWATDNGADVISMSIGSTSQSDTIQEAVEYAWGEGVVLIAAAGNDGDCSDCVSYPAAYPEVAAVTCTNSDEAQCSFSSQGPEAEFAAPGNDILSTYNDGDYTELSGTSMSAPHVSGVAALMLSVDDSLTNTEVRDTLNATAQDLGADGHDNVYGHGEVDAEAAVDAVSGGGGNDAPTADFTHDCTDLDCTFDASASSDPDGSITSYDWELGDGNTDTGEVVDHTYAEGGTYTVNLTVTDDDGATDTASQDVSVSEDGGTGPLFSEDFDDGTADGFTLDGLWHVSDACETPPSTPNYLGYNQDSTCDYDTGEANSGTATFSVDLSSVSEANLTFQHKWETESTSCGLLGCSEYDTMDVEISSDGGSSWDTLDSWSSLDDNQLEFTEATYTIDDYTGGTADIRYVFDTVDSTANDHPGWFIDDVTVE